MPWLAHRYNLIQQKLRRIFILLAMNSYTAIAIIYNPNSTGPSQANARELEKQLKATKLRKLVKVIPTQHAGHAEDLAYKLAKTTERPLIIMSSGDGGYHEAINGALRAQAEGATPTCGLLPSGNANDHYRNLHKRPVAEQIVAGKQRRIDILKLQTTIDGQPWQRYAHSYIGVGLTPKVAMELNKVKLNRLLETWIVIKTLHKMKATRLVVHGQERSYDSLIFSNVGSMSKVLSLSDSAELTDGKFEVISFRSHSKLYLLRQLVKAVTIGLHATRHTDHYSFTTVKPISLQLDGEIHKVSSKTDVAVRLEPGLLRCII